MLNSAASDEILESAPYKLRRTNSETLRAQYINTKELRCVVRSVSAMRAPILRFRLNLFFVGCRVCVGTWNTGGRAPPEDLDIAEWLGTGGDAEPADIYVLG